MSAKKTMLIERDRTHYARAHGDAQRVGIADLRRIELELPASYARDLLAALRHTIAAGGDFDSAQISLDVPMRLSLSPVQTAQLIERLATMTDLVPPRVFVRKSTNPERPSFEICAACDKHIRHHFGDPASATAAWPAYRCDPKPDPISP